MGLLSMLIVGFWAVLLVGFVFALIVSIIFNMKAGEKYRHQLASKINELRLSRMLGALGIDFRQYLHNERIIDIQNHMERCSQCENTEECDDQLLNENIDSEKIAFCKNEQDLQTLLKKQTGHI